MGLRGKLSAEHAELLKKLDDYYDLIDAVVLDKQNPVSGLLPASTAVTSHGDYRDAWVRDNVYSILCVWALALAYEKVDYDQGRTYELKHAVVKLMRGLLFAMMRQSEKVETFKRTQNLADSLHAKYNTSTCETVVGDHEWGHLQLDATSFFLLTLAQMTSSGLQIIFTLDEVDFVQNLVFYIERAYRTPDFGVWERGNKINNGQAELNCSSIGMVTAALEAINGLDLFGSRGGPRSVIHVLPDEISRNYTTLQSFLPRESDSKEVDAGVLAVIGYPAFAAGSLEIIAKTREELKAKLEGPYGLKRFLLDGHQTVVEDLSRLYYQPHELRIFRGIECEWPLFFTYIIIDHLFQDNLEEAREYRKKLENTLIDHELPNGMVAKLVPELYYVPEDKIAEVRQNPSAMVRVANDNIPLVWAQSLMIVGDLLLDELISVGELDPIGRRFRPLRERKDTLVQIVLVSEDEALQSTLSYYGLETETIEQISPIKIHPSHVLSDLYSNLGVNKKLGLTGRPNRPIGSIGTSKVYRINGEIHVFTPVFMEIQKFYLTMDNDIVIGLFKDELQFVRNNWHLSGRPTMFMVLTKAMFNSVNRKNLLNLMVSLKSGVCNKVRVRLGRMKEMINSSCVDNLDFLSQNLSYRHILSPTRMRSNSSQHLKIEGDQTIKSNQPSRRNSFLGRLERRSISLSFLDMKLRDLENFSTSEDESEDAGDDSSESEYHHHLTASEIETLRKVSIEECVANLKESNNAFVQIEILEHLVTNNGIDFVIEGFASLRDLLEELYQRSARAQHWSVTRQAAALLKKAVDSLTSNIVDLLIRQKQLILGPASSEYLISAPHSPAALHELINKYYAINDVREASLVQEILTFLGSFIRAEPHIFEGIMRLKVSYLLSALKLEVASEEKISQEEAFERVFHLPPSSIKRLLYRTLAIREDSELSSMTCDFDELKANGHPSFNPQIYAHLLSQDSESGMVTGTVEEYHTKKKKVQVIARSAGFLDGNVGRVEVGGKVVFEMERRGIGVVVIDDEDGSIINSESFDTHSSKEDSSALADFISSQDKNAIIAAVVKDEASECLTEGAKAAFELIGSLRIREIGYRASWAIIYGKDGTVEDFHYAKEGAVEELESTFEVWDSASMDFLRPSSGKWKLRRLFDGGLNRVPHDFYPAAFEVLRRARQGLLIGNNLLPRNPTVDDMTPRERNFALKIQSWLDTCENPIDRQLLVECLVVISKIAQRNPEVKINGVIQLDAIVENAIKMCWSTLQPEMGSRYDEFRPFAREFFYDLPVQGVHGSLSFLIKVAVGIPFTMNTSAECTLS